MTAATQQPNNGVRRRRVLKVLSLLILSAATLVLLAGLAFWYFMDVHPRHIDTASSPDQKYSVEFVEVGSAVFFGPSTVRIELSQDAQRISDITTRISNDGANLDATNWEVQFGDTFVEVILRGDEQPDEHLRLCYEPTGSETCAPVE